MSSVSGKMPQKSARASEATFDTLFFVSSLIDQMPPKNSLSSPPWKALDIQHDRIIARLSSGTSVTILLFGATIISWKLSDGQEQLWMSEAATINGKDPVRGGIPIVFPVFDRAPNHKETIELPQHGFARTTFWRLKEDVISTDNIRLVFGLSSEDTSDAIRSAWPFNFSLTYEVLISDRTLKTGLSVTNIDKRSWEFQSLLHTALAVKDVTAVTVAGLGGNYYIDKTDAFKQKQQERDKLEVTGHTDRIYLAPQPGSSPSTLTITQESNTAVSISRAGFKNVVVFNPWEERARTIEDFMPKDAWRRMLCVEVGLVDGWKMLEPGQTWEGWQILDAGAPKSVQH